MEIFEAKTSKKSGSSIRKRIRDIKRTGVIGEAVWETDPYKISLGHNFEAADMSIYSQSYVPEDGNLAYRGYGRMAIGGTAYINSPYLKLAGSYDILNWQAGLKYFHCQEADSQGYMNGPGPEYTLLRTPDLDRDVQPNTISCCRP